MAGLPANRYGAGRALAATLLPRLRESRGFVPTVDILNHNNVKNINCLSWFFFHQINSKHVYQFFKIILYKFRETAFGRLCSEARAHTYTTHTVTERYAGIRFPVSLNYKAWERHEVCFFQGLFREIAMVCRGRFDEWFWKHYPEVEVDPCEAELAGCFVPPETELVLKMLAWWKQVKKNCLKFLDKKASA